MRCARCTQPATAVVRYATVASIRRGRGEIVSTVVEYLCASCATGFQRKEGKRNVKVSWLPEGERA